MFIKFPTPILCKFLDSLQAYNHVKEIVKLSSYNKLENLPKTFWMKTENLEIWFSVLCYIPFNSNVYFYIQCSYSGEMQSANSVAIIALSHCLYRFLDGKKLATSNLPFHAFEGFIRSYNKSIFSNLASFFWENPHFVLLLT